MVSNYERILDEITTEADRVVGDTGMSADLLTDLVMKIVDAEDRHRIKSININQEVENMITTAALDRLRN